MRAETGKLSLPSAKIGIRREREETSSGQELQGDPKIGKTPEIRYDWGAFYNNLIR